jgi:mannose-6-phosphate isomerase-like protein (cupin superfamily)
MLEPTEMIEVKQGPYVGEQDKTRFAGVAAADVRLRGGA